MFLQPLDLTTALRPSLLPDETLLFVQDAVGLYEGYKHLRPSEHYFKNTSPFANTHVRTSRKYKIPNLQNGHAYLTTHRACYVDKLEPRKSSIAIELKSVDKYEFYVRMEALQGSLLYVIEPPHRLASSNLPPK